MNYKIVSNNKELIQKATHVFNILDMNESIHIQEVDIWLVDVQTMDEKSIVSYKNRLDYSHIIFIVNNDAEIKLCLQNSFTNYINKNFSNDELISWCKFFRKNSKKTVLELENSVFIDFNKSQIYDKTFCIDLTRKELSLLKELSSGQFVKTDILSNALLLNSQTSVRTIINRIRKKVEKDIFSQKRDFGYKLNIQVKNELEIFVDSNIKELEEQNSLMQEVIDSSPMFIVTFVHKQLYCINKSFRDFLGNDIIKELWEEENGDFFQLIKYKSSKIEELKDSLFSMGKKEIDLYNFNRNKVNSFTVNTFYFENIDKHLLMFSLIK